jgi:hypothetical protein
LHFFVGAVSRRNYCPSELFNIPSELFSVELFPIGTISHRNYFQRNYFQRNYFQRNYFPSGLFPVGTRGSVPPSNKYVMNPTYFMRFKRAALKFGCYLYLIFVVFIRNRVHIILTINISLDIAFWSDYLASLIKTVRSDKLNFTAVTVDS